MLELAYDKTGVCKSIKKYGFAMDSNDDPEVADCQTKNFAMFYNTRESMNSFSALYDNVEGLTDKWVEYWNQTSAAFANNPYVIGYDPLNEPYPGNFARDDKLLIPGHLDAVKLAPMYTSAYEKYIANDPENIMWFMPASFPDEAGFLGGQVYDVGFTTPPGGEIGSPNHVLNDHTYCCQMSASECKTGEP